MEVRTGSKGSRYYYALEKICIVYMGDRVKPCYGNNYGANYVTINIFNPKQDITCEVRSEYDPKVRLYEITNGTFLFEASKLVYLILAILFTIMFVFCCIICLLLTVFQILFIGGFRFILTLIDRGTFDNL
jgi:hypothetical protein